MHGFFRPLTTIRAMGLTAVENLPELGRSSWIIGVSLSSLTEYQRATANLGYIFVPCVQNLQQAFRVRDLVSLCN